MSKDGSITIATEIDNKKAQQELNRLTKTIDKLSGSMEQAQSAQQPLINQAEGLRQRMAEAADQAERYKAAWKAGVLGADRDEAGARERVAALRAEYDGILDKIEVYDAKIADAGGRLAQAKAQAGALAEELGGAGRETQRMANASKRAQKSMEQLSMRMRGILLGAFVFNILSAGLRNFVGWMGKTIRSNDQAAAAIAKLKGALLTLAQPLVEVVIPAFTTLTNVVTNIISNISRFFSMLFGKNIDQSRQAAENLYDEANALDDTGKAAKKAAKSLASFDEINILPSSKENTAANDKAEGIKPDFSKFDMGEYKGKIDAITTYMMGALLALGAILAFSGVNIPLGIGLMALGAVGLAAEMAVNWDSMSPELRTAITNTMLVLGAAVLVIGAVLAFSGANIPLGVGLMAAGAAGLAAAAALNWDAVAKALQGAVGVVAAIVGGVLLAVGAVLAFSGANIPLGIGLMAVGAIGLAAAAAVNWDVVVQALQGPVGVVTALISGAILVLGAVLTFTGANLPLGIGLMAAGAAGMAAVAAVNWETVSKALQGPIGAIAAVVSGALLVLGALFTFTGANIPLGIGLMIAGAAGLAAAAAANWDTIQKALEGPIGKITAMVCGALLVLGAVLTFTGANLPLGIGLLAVGAIGLVAAAAVNWEAVVTALQGPIGKVAALASGALLALGIILTLSGVSMPLGIALMAAGAVGLVTVGALNWNAVLDKLKETWSGITNWWSSHVGKFFTADYWKGRGKDILDGLFGGMAGFGPKLSEWGAGLIDGVKSIFGIHSPSTEFENLGMYMMQGLGNGLSGNAAAVEQAMSAVFGRFAEQGTGAVGTLKGDIAAFLAYMAAEFTAGWQKAWEDCHTSVAACVSRVITEIDLLNAKLASIERNIAITITTNYGGTAPQGAALGGAGAARLAAVPALARGAVIPPNRAFTAVLGDQKNGSNLEAPEGLIRQIIREEMGGAERRAPEINLVLGGSLSQLARVLNPYIEYDGKRRGVKLIKGGGRIE